MTTERETVLYEKKGHIVHVMLNRPEKLNTLSTQLSSELSDAWAEFDADDDARVAILSGNGGAFCAGDDVNNRLDPKAQRKAQP
jgi:enoyl-CoA hydratase